MELLFLAILIGLMMLTLGLGFPVAFALPGSAIATIGLAAGTGYVFAGSTDAYFAHGSAVEWLSAGVTNFRGIYWEAERDTLIAIPLFIFMGIMLQRSKIAEELLVTMARLFGGLPGGLGISVVVVGALLAATTGIVGATVVAMGLISLPAMLRNNYSHPLATGTILSSGTLGQIIPPSIVLIILADQLSSAVDQASAMRQAAYREATGQFSMPSELDVVTTSAGDMFMGALIPGMVLVGLYVLYILGYALLRPQNAPSVPIDTQMDRRFWTQVFFATVPPLALIFIVLGSIIMGVATVTQAGAVGAAGATVMAGYKLYEGRGRYVPAILAVLSLFAIGYLHATFNLNLRSLEFSTVGVTLAVIAVFVLVFALGWSALRAYHIDGTLTGVMSDTAKTTSLVFIILLGAAMLISAFRAFGGEVLVKDFLGGLPGGFWMQFILVMLVIFLLGFFLDFIEIAIVVVPIVAPILLMNPEANVTAIWLGVMIGLNIQTSFLTPPFGFALFYLRGVAAATVRTVSMYKGVVPFIALQLLSLVIVGFNPQLVNYLPARVSLLSETAPPPRNPRLQQCVEGILLREIPQAEGEIRAAIAELRTADLAVLPPFEARQLETALEGFEEGFDLLEEFRAALQRVEDATPSYRPLHREVSRLNAEVARRDTMIERLQRQARFLRGETAELAEARADIAARIEALEQEKAEILADIPERWDAEHDAFLEVLREENMARNAFRRSTEQGYVVLRELADTITAGEEIAAMLPRLAELPQVIADVTPEEAGEHIRALEREVGSLPGGNDLRGALSDVRRSLTGRNASEEDALEQARDALDMARAEVDWRQAAAAGWLADLERLEAATRLNFGLREQDRLTRDQALEVAACVANPPDVSLRF